MLDPKEAVAHRVEPRYARNLKGVGRDDRFYFLDNLKNSVSVFGNTDSARLATLLEDGF